MRPSFPLMVIFFGDVFCREQGAIAGFSTSIPCNFDQQEQAPFWIINGTVYDLFTISRVFSFVPVVDSYSALKIPVVPLSLHGTTFQCAIFRSEKADPIDQGTFTRLSVAPNPRGEDGFEDLINVALVVDFQRLFIFETSTTLGWFANKRETCSRDFQVRGFTLLPIGPVLSRDHVFNVSNATSYQLPSTQYTNNVGVSIDYRLEVLNDVCRSNRLANYYRLSNSSVLEWRVINRNAISPICYTIPKKDFCVNSLYFYSKNHGCPVHNSTQGQATFQQCTDGYTDNKLVPVLTSSGEICFYPTSFRNESLFHFVCSSNPCTNTNEECLLRTILSSHIAIFAGPPSTPDIAYNGSFLCFSAYAHKEFPVLNFDVEINDAAEIPVTVMAGTYSTNGPYCLDVSSVVCLPFEVSVLAANAIGATSTTQLLFSSKDGEQFKLDVTNIASASVTVSLSCSRTAASSRSYILETPGTNERRSFTIECGGSIDLPDLSAKTDYHILRGGSICRVKNFTTAPDLISSTSVSSPHQEGLIVGVAAAMTMVVLSILWF